MTPLGRSESWDFSRLLEDSSSGDPLDVVRGFEGTLGHLDPPENLLEDWVSFDEGLLREMTGAAGDVPPTAGGGTGGVAKERVADGREALHPRELRPAAGPVAPFPAAAGSNPGPSSLPLPCPAQRLVTSGAAAASGRGGPPAAAHGGKQQQRSGSPRQPPQKPPKKKKVNKGRSKDPPPQLAARQQPRCPAPAAPFAFPGPFPGLSAESCARHQAFFSQAFERTRELARLSLVYEQQLWEMQRALLEMEAWMRSSPIGYGALYWYFAGHVDSIRWRSQGIVQSWGQIEAYWQPPLPSLGVF